MIYIIPPTQWHTWFDVFVTGDRELAAGNLNPFPVAAEQLKCSVSGEVKLTLAPSSPRWKKDVTVCRHKSSASGGSLLSHVFVWVQSLNTVCPPPQGWQPVVPSSLILMPCLSAPLGITSARRVLWLWNKSQPLTLFNNITLLNSIRLE